MRKPRSGQTCSFVTYSQHGVWCKNFISYHYWMACSRLVPSHFKFCPSLGPGAGLPVRTPTQLRWSHSPGQEAGALNEVMNLKITKFKDIETQCFDQNRQVWQNQSCFRYARFSRTIFKKCFPGCTWINWIGGSPASSNLSKSALSLTEVNALYRVLFERTDLLKTSNYSSQQA